MKHLAFIILALVAIHPVNAADPIEVPIPIVSEVKQPISFPLDGAQVQQLVKALVAAGVALPSGINQVVIRVAVDGSATVNITFRNAKSSPSVNDHGGH